MKRVIRVSKVVSTVGVMGAAYCVCGAVLGNDAKAVAASACFAAIVCLWLPAKALLDEKVAEKLSGEEHGDV